MFLNRQLEDFSEEGSEFILEDEIPVDQVNSRDEVIQHAGHNNDSRIIPRPLGPAEEIKDEIIEE